MKILFIVACLLVAQHSVARDCGYWVTESNQASRYALVRIYRLDGTLLHEAKLTGKIIDSTKARATRRFNKMVTKIIQPC
jgi:hypothetical protein